jgi:hypothetical protein
VGVGVGVGWGGWGWGLKQVKKNVSYELNDRLIFCSMSLSVDQMIVGHMSIDKMTG